MHIEHKGMQNDLKQTEKDHKDMKNDHKWTQNTHKETKNEQKDKKDAITTISPALLL